MRRTRILIWEFFVTVGPWIFPLVGGILLSAATATHPMPGLLTVETF